MSRVVMLLAATALACVAGAAAESDEPLCSGLWRDADPGSQCGGFLAGIVYAGVATNCSFVVLDNETDKTKIENSVSVCTDHAHARRLRPSQIVTPSVGATGFSSFSNPTKCILYTTGDGANVWTIATSGGATTAVAALPDSYAPIVGLAVATGLSGDAGNGGWFVVTTTDLLLIDVPTKTTASVMDLTGLKLSSSARVKAYNVSLYIADQMHVHTIDLLTYSVVRSVELTNPVMSRALTLEYWLTNSTLITVVDRNVYEVDTVSGESWVMMTLPPGTGPVNRAANFGDMFFLTDNNEMYLTNLRVRILETTAPWPGQTTSGSIEYYY